MRTVSQFVLYCTKIIPVAGSKRTINRFKIRAWSSGTPLTHLLSVINNGFIFRWWHYRGKNTIFISFISKFKYLLNISSVSDVFKVPALFISPLEKPLLDLQKEKKKRKNRKKTKGKRRKGKGGKNQQRNRWPSRSLSGLKKIWIYIHALISEYLLTPGRTQK